jgi:hypothetical protein
MPDFVSFNEFIDRTASARIAHLADTLQAGLRRVVAPKAAVKADVLEEEFEKMKKYVLDLYEGVTSDHTYLDPGGNFIDCIPFEQQAAVRAARKAGHKVKEVAPPPTRPEAAVKVDPMAFGPEPSGMVPPLRRGLTDVFGKPIACPEDRVPLRRITLYQLARLGKLEYFFRKHPGRDFDFLGKKSAKTKSRTSSAKAGAKKRATGRSKAVAPEVIGGRGEVHRHAICQTKPGSYTGCSSWLNIWDVDPSPGVFNLSQQWLLGSTAAGAVQTIESGWQVYPELWGTTAPVLFLFYNPGGYDPSTSGYVTNQNGQGFIQQSPSWAFGSALAQVSTRGGPQFGVQMQWEIDADGNWWLYLGSDASSLEAAGYFPAGLYQNGSLSQSAQAVQFGGEVSSQAPPSRATGPMGSGLPPFEDPADGFGEVAFQKLISVQTSVGGSMNPADLDPDEPDQPNYRAALGSSEKWKSFLFFGGASAP